MANTEITGKFTKGEIGSSGTIVTQGFIGMNDWDREVTGTRGLRTFDKMRNGDPHIKAAYTAITEPIIQANWFITPGSNTPQDEEISDFIDDALFSNMSITFTDFLRQSLLYLAYGFYVFEIVYDFDPINNKIVWKKFAPRLPWTIIRWQLNNGDNGVVQQMANGQEAQIPIEKLIIFVHEKEGDNWTGRSLFKAAFSSWKYKQGLEKIDAISHERQGLGIPTMTYPAGANAQEKDKAEQILRNIRAHQQAHVLLTEGWTFEITDMKGGSTRNASESLKYHTRNILMSMLAQFLELGGGGGRSSGGGSYALSKDQSRIFELTLGSYCKHIAEAFNRYVIPRLVDMNFSNVEHYPTLEYSKLGDIDMNVWSTSLQRLVAAQIVHPDENTEDYARDIMDLPEVTAEDRAELELEKFLNEMEGKPVFTPTAVGSAGGMGGGGQAGGGQDNGQPENNTNANETIKGAVLPDANTQISQDQKPADNVNLDDEFQKSRGLKADLALFINSKRIELIQRRKDGKPFTPEQVQQIIIDVLEKKQEVTSQMPAAQFKEGMTVHDTLLKMYERVDDAITNIESEQS